MVVTHVRVRLAAGSVNDNPDRKNVLVVARKECFIGIILQLYSMVLRSKFVHRRFNFQIEMLVYACI